MSDDSTPKMQPEKSPKTVLVTGCSSGYGLATATYFLERGARVVATMRRPNAALFSDRFGPDRLRIVALDVTSDESIAAALEASGPIDVLVNNAGIGAFGPFEGVPKAVVRDVFETNTFGVMALTQAVLPQMRARRSGTVVNVTSSATLAPMPLVAVYTASKMAIEGFTASLAFELASVGVRAKLVEPGYCARTAFTQNSGARIERGAHEDYAPFTMHVMEAFASPTETTTPHDVAEAVYRAVHDTSTQLRFPAGADAVALAAAAA